jgi:hypothetical protein
VTAELGVIEGYYGRPWSWAMREEQARFLAAHDYRFYIYAPKADAFLRRRWREDHPAQDADGLKRVAGACAEVGMAFGVGLSPFEAYRGFDADAQGALARKLAFFDDAGARILAILFDDMRGDQPDLAEAQIRIAHWAAERTKAARIILCPTYYCDDPMLERAYGAAPPRYLEDLGAGLDPAIELFWTGEEVCSREYSPGHLARVTEQMRRKPTLWDNYPVNDGPGMSPYLHLRPFTGRPAAIGQHLAAHAVNPSLQPLLFRIPALTLVESYRLGDAYQYWQAFDHAALEVAGPELARLLRRHARPFHEQGRERLGDDVARLRQRYAAIDHPAAQEVVAWLDGEWVVTREMMEAS